MQYRFEWQIFLNKHGPLGLGVVKQEFDTYIEAKRFAIRLREGVNTTSKIRIVQIPDETSVFV